MRSTYLPARHGAALWCLALSAGALLMNAGPAAAASSTTTTTTTSSALTSLQQQIQALQQQLNDLKATQANAQQQIQAQQQAIAAVSVPKAEPAGTKLVPNKLALSTADGNFTIGLTGRLNLDAGGYLNYEPGIGQGTTRLSDGVNARRARLGVAGTIMQDFSYALIVDAGGATDGTAYIENAYISYLGLQNTAIEGGYMDTLFTLDEAVSSNDIMFMERSFATNIAEAFGTGDNRSVLGARTWDDNWYASAYVTGPLSAGSSATITHSNTQEQFGVFGRVGYNPIQTTDATVHLGFGVDHMLAAPTYSNGYGSLSLSDRPELRIDPTSLISLGSVGNATNPLNSGTVYDAEFAAGFDSVFFQGEYYHYALEREGLSGNSFDGGYGQIGWVLTGESRKYNPTTGGYSGVKPDHPFSLSTGGWGAWEIGGRVSYIDMNDSFTPGLAVEPTNYLDGGKAIDFTLGVNWYVSNNMRFMVDYVHSHYMKTLAGTAAENAGYISDGLAARAQFNF